MKKLIPIMLLAAGLLTANVSFAQNINVTLTTQPCNGNGVLTATFTGLTTPLTVSWNEQGQAPVVHNNVTTLTDVYNNYWGAPVNISVTDANNQTAYKYVQASFPFTFQVSTVPAVCPATGTATATISGGTAPYTYQWRTSPGNVTVSTSNPASLPGGFYTLQVTDANGCTYLDDSTNTVYMNQSVNFNYSVSTTPANCTNGTASVSGLTGGTAPFTYLWSNAATTSTITGLTYGNYSVTVTDANGCSLPRSGFVSQSVNIGTNMVSKPATCLQNDGSITSFGSGGTPPYSYLWNNSATTQNISGLSAGIYSVKITDANGCSGTGTRYVGSSTPITVTTSANPSSCTGATGSAQLTISGGTAPYNVQWFTSPGQTGNTAINLAQGTYQFKITDAVGCIRTGTVYVPPVNVINLSLTSSPATCTQANGSAGVTATGGATPYTYLWSNSATTPSISNVQAGGYSVTVTDNVGCSVKKFVNVPVTTPLQVGFSTSPASCLYNSDGSATATAWNGTTPYTYSWDGGPATATYANLAKGNYWVNVTDANGCKVRKMTNVGYNPNNNSCYCTITGTVYNDVNSNCVKDAGEQGIRNIRIHCTGMGYAYTDTNGNYSFQVPTGSYTISQTVLGYYPLASCQSNSIAVNATAGTNCTHTVNFANTITPIHDMQINTWHNTPPVPGYAYKQKCIITNMGTVTENSVNAGYNTDGQLLSPVFSPNNIFTGSGNQYNITGTSLSLAPGNSQVFTVNYNVPTNIPLNTSVVFKDTVAYTAPISNWQNDYSPWNNVNYYSPVVVGSYDPNFKEVNPAGKGPNGIISRDDTSLKYMVHFQNLGTYKAFNIYILDTLDADLDWSTFRPVYQSHPCKITMSEQGVIRFQFDNIDLPAKMHDEEGSNGMVVYTINTKKGLPLGTQFTNSAAIYFDFNDPVITNTTVNTIGNVSVEQVANNNNGNVTVYPNPAHDQFTVRVDEGSYSSLKIMNAMGQVVSTQNIYHKETRVNLGNAAPGIYFVMLQGDDGVVMRKIEKL